MEQQNPLAPEVTFVHHQDPSAFKRRILKTTLILSVVTLIELGIGITIYFMHKGGHPNPTTILFLKGLVCILTLLKAYYIVSVFMHLGDEIHRFIMTIVAPLILFAWLIIALLWDGNSFKNLRNTYDPYFYETTMPGQQTPAAPLVAPEPGRQ